MVSLDVATHVVAHLVDYFRGATHAPSDNRLTGDERGWGLAGNPGVLGSLDELIELRQAVECEGLKLEAIENFEPAHWHDILLDGPNRDPQIETIKAIIRHVGQAGAPIIGYNFRRIE